MFGDGCVLGCGCCDVVGLGVFDLCCGSCGFGYFVGVVDGVFFEEFV